VLYVTAICYAGHRLSRAVCSPFWLDPLAPTRRCASTGDRGVESCQASTTCLEAIPYVTPSRHEFSHPAPSLVESLVDLDAPPLLGLRPYPTIGVGVTGRQRAGQETVKAKTLQSHYLYDLLNFTLPLPSPATYSLGK